MRWSTANGCAHWSLNDIGPEVEPGSRAHHADGRQPAGRVRDIGRRDGLPSRGFADRRRARRRRPARAGTRRIAAATRWQMGLEDGRGLYPPARRTRRAGPPQPVADAGEACLSDLGCVGHRQRRAIGGAGAAHGSGMRRAWSSRPRSPVSKVSCLACSLQRAPRVLSALAPVGGSRCALARGMRRDGVPGMRTKRTSASGLSGRHKAIAGSVAGTVESSSTNAASGGSIVRGFRAMASPSRRGHQGRGHHDRRVRVRYLPPRSSSTSPRHHQSTPEQVRSLRGTATLRSTAAGGLVRMAQTQHRQRGEFGTVSSFC